MSINLRELEYPFDSRYILKCRKKIKRILLENNTQSLKIKVAVLGGSTTDDVAASLELFLINMGFMPEFYQSEYNMFWQDAVFGNDVLSEFKPDLIYIHTTYRNVKFPAGMLRESDEKAAVQEQFGYFKTAWTALSERFSCPIIQNNFEMPLCRHFGNSDCYNLNGKTYFISQLNIMMAEYAQKNNGFYINDINYLSACMGLEKWHNYEAWYLYKYAMNIYAIPELAYSVACIINSVYGKNKKVIALDLDNTLWGGVIGDDGVEQIEIGQETPVAQSFSDFQAYVKKYTDFGVVLSVCSKNDEENALIGLNHPETVLKPEHFAGIKANWEPKDININALAEELSLTADSFVFVDDNPAECHRVKSQLPGVSVICFDEVHEAMYKLSRGGYFEVTTLSDDDLKRNNMYKSNRLRADSEKSFADYSDYLRSLEMRAVISEFEPIYLSRITQLTNKSNQFNLTTKRYTSVEMEAVFNDDNYVRLYGKLEDKFGDNGIVSVVIGRKLADMLHIDLWLMSCRVLKRNMEHAMLDELVYTCKQLNLNSIIGYYYRTSKNNMVSDLYKSFGFNNTEMHENGDSVWELDVKSYKKLNSVIKVNEREMAANEQK